MKGYTTISTRPSQKEKLKIIKTEDETYGDVIDDLIQRCDFDEETEEELKELEEELEE